MPKSRRISDPEILKGLAQPVRQRIYRLLSQIGPATVGMLAKELGGADPGLVSYHLRELARRGFVEDVPELARDRRERWWRRTAEGIGWNSLDFRSPEGRAIAAAVKAQMVVDEFERLRRYEQTREDWDEAWQQAAISSDAFLRLTAAEFAELAGELQAVLDRWVERSRAVTAQRGGAEDTGTTRMADRESVFVFLHAFPERSR